MTSRQLLIPKQDPAFARGSWVPSTTCFLLCNMETGTGHDWPSWPATSPDSTSHPSCCTDFNNDDYICAWDLEQTVTKLTRGELSAEEVSLVCEKVLDEADGDHDGRLSLEDFQNMILRAPDFLR